MAITRLGSAVLLGNTLDHVASTQQKLAEMQTQISSGYRASDFAGLNGSVERFTVLQAQQRRTEQFKQDNAITESQLQAADNALTDVIESATSLRTLMVQTRSATGYDINFEQQARDLLAAIGSQLNVSSAGKYVLGGTNTNFPPVPDTTVPTTEIGVPDASYYRGSEHNTVVRIDETTQFEFPARADDPAIQKLFAATFQAIQAFSNRDDVGMASAVSLMEEANDGLTGLRAKVQSAQINVADTNARLTSQSLYLKGVVDTVSKTDVVAVTTEIANYQSILQATFQVYARLSQLRLSDYLK